jgi:hypothetical protein
MGLIAMALFLRNSSFMTVQNVLCLTCKMTPVVLISQKNPGHGTKILAGLSVRIVCTLRCVVLFYLVATSKRPVYIIRNCENELQ